MKTEHNTTLPIVLTIAGTDTGGGAGIQADLKTFAALKTHGCSVVTCLTAQNPKEVLAILPSTPEFLSQQLTAVFNELPPVAVKTGMLYSAELIHTVAAFLQQHPVPLVLDPVMISTSRAQLLKADAVQTMCTELFPLANILTPNLDEAAYLLGHPIQNRDEHHTAARELYQHFERPILLKGGHLPGPEAVDILWDGKQEFVYTNTFIQNVSTHGTGCTFSAAITAYLAHQLPLEEATRQAKDYLHTAIQTSVKIGNHYALNWFCS